MKNLLPLLITLILASCAKDLPLNISDDISENVHGIAAIESAEFQITTGESSPQALSTANPLLTDKMEVEVVSNTAPAPFNQMFDNAKIYASPNTTYAAKLKIFENQYLVAMIEEQGVSAAGLEKGMMEVMAIDGMTPVVAYAIQGFGYLQRAKNELNEETRNVEFKDVAPGSATHVRVSLLPSARQLIIPTKEQTENVFSIRKIEDQKLIIKTGDKATADSKVAGLASIAEVQGANSLVSLFSQLYVPLKEKSEYTVFFKLQDENSLALFAKVTEVDLANPALKALLIDGALPLASYPIQSLGFYEQLLDGNGKKQLSAQLKRSSRQKATHIVIDALPESRTSIGLSQNQLENIYGIKQLTQELAIRIKTGTRQSTQTQKKLSLSSKYGQSLVEVVDVQSNVAEIIPVIKGMRLPLPENFETTLRFELRGGKYLVATALMLDEKIEDFQSVIFQNGRLPLFYFPVQSFGSFQQVLNEKNEKGLKLQFKETAIEDATHIQISFLPQTLSMAGIGSMRLSELEQVFQISDLENRIIKNSELFSLLGRRLTKENDGQVLKFELDTTGSLIIKVAKTLSQLTSLEREALENTQLSNEVKKCSEEEVKTIQTQTSDFNESCILVSKYEMAFQALGIKSIIESQERPFVSPRFALEKLEDRSDAKFVMFDTDQIFKNSDWIEDIGNFAASKFILPVKSFETEGKEKSRYYFRRVLIDSPNSFNYTFAGTSGDLQIVEFNFTEDSVEIKKAYADLDKPGSSDVDREVLMKLPVHGYYRIITKDTDGTQLKRPRYQRTTFDDSQAVAFINWSQNRIPEVNSPLSYYDLGECFAGDSGQQVGEFTSDEDGMGLTLTHNFVANPSVGCVDIWGRGYFDGQAQTQLSFKERLSFKKVKEDLNSDSFAGNIPYESQKKLGFGIFTYGKVVPDEFGGTFTNGSMQALPAIFDIKNDKKIVYTLAGIPQLVSSNGKLKKDALFKINELREALITSTKETISDLNVGFDKAFEGTGFRSSGVDVIELTLEMDPTFEVMIKNKYGIKLSANADMLPAMDLTQEQNNLEKVSETEFNYLGMRILPKKSMGDLERNYVYYVEKQTDNPIIGLGGAHPNLVNGKVESASIYLYGGNMRGMIKSFRKLEAAEELYQKNMTPKIALDDKIKKNEEDGEELEDQPTAAGQDEEANPIAVDQHLKQALGKLKTALAKEKTIHIERAVKAQGQKLFSQNFFVQATKAKTEEGFSAKGDKGQALLSRFGSSRPSTQLAMWLENTREQATENNSWNNKEALVSLLQQGMPAYLFKGQGDIQGLKLAQSKKSQFEARFMQKMQEKGLCLYTADSLQKALEGEGKKTKDMSNLELFIASWKPTVAHELGHNLGLRHNFIASFDGKNHKFDQADQSHRTYSSVMDYLIDDHLTYDGLGPYDVHALRAAYTGLLEVNPVEGQTEKKFVKIAEIPSLLGISNWSDLTKRDLAKLNLKNYAFCSDEDASQNPVCERFDFGTTAVEAVNHKINQYLIRYSLANFPGDKLDFSSSSAGGYIGSIFNTFLSIRHFLEEGFYQAIFERPLTNTPEAQKEFGVRVNDYLLAAYKGFQFLIQVVRTPEVPEYISATSDERFISTVLTLPKRDPETGEVKQIKVPTVIETKANRDQAKETDMARLSIRGTEFDKTIALIALTTDTFGYPRFLRKSLVVSYPMFEKFVLESDLQSSELVELLSEILSDNITPSAWTKDGFSVPLSAPFYSDKTALKTDVSEIMRNYAVIGAIANLDINTFESSLNPSRAFRVLSDLKTEAKTPYVTQEEGDMRYYAITSAFASADLIKSGDQFRRLKASGMNEKLGEFATIALSTLGMPAPPLPEVTYSAEELKKVNETLAALELEKAMILKQLEEGKDKEKTPEDEEKDKTLMERLQAIDDETIEALKVKQALILQKLEKAPEAGDAQTLRLAEDKVLEMLRAKVKEINQMIDLMLQMGMTPDQLKGLIINRMMAYLDMKAIIAQRIDEELPDWIDPERPLDINAEVLEGFLVNNILIPAVNVELKGQYPGRAADISNSKGKLEQIAKNIPLIGGTLSAVATENFMIFIPQAKKVVVVKSLAEIAPTGVADDQTHTITSNVKFLSDIFTIIHPDYQ